MHTKLYGLLVGPRPETMHMLGNKMAVKNLLEAQQVRHTAIAEESFFSPKFFASRTGKFLSFLDMQEKVEPSYLAWPN